MTHGVFVGQNVLTGVVAQRDELGFAFYGPLRQLAVEVGLDLFFYTFLDFLVVLGVPVGREVPDTSRTQTGLGEIEIAYSHHIEPLDGITIDIGYLYQQVFQGDAPRSGSQSRSKQGNERRIHYKTGEDRQVIGIETGRHAEGGAPGVDTDGQCQIGKGQPGIERDSHIGQ